MDCKVKSTIINILNYNQLQELFKEYSDVKLLNINIGDTLKHDLCRNAAEKGNLSILKWARETGCYWDEWTCTFAAKNGHIEVLQWARQHGCPWNEYTCSCAAGGGHLSVLQWAREHGCPWNGLTCACAANSGHIEVLKWARKNGCPWDEKTCTWAARGGHMEVLQWARENGCPWDQWTCDYAAEQCHLDVFKWAIENGCHWDIKPIKTFICLQLLEKKSFYFSHFILNLLQTSKENDDIAQKQIIQLQQLVQQINENVSCLDAMLCQDIQTIIKNYL